MTEQRAGLIAVAGGIGCVCVVVVLAFGLIWLLAPEAAPPQPAASSPPLAHVEKVATIPDAMGPTGVWTFCDRGNRVYVHIAGERAAMAVAEGGGPVGCR